MNKKKSKIRLKNELKIFVFILFFNTKNSIDCTFDKILYRKKTQS